MKKLGVIFLILALIGGGFFYMKKKKTKELIPVKTVKVKRGEVKNIVEASGMMKPQVGAKVKVGARISGTVIKENVKVGDYVKKGDLIAVIDNRELGENLKVARANLEEIKKIYPKKIETQKLAIETAEASLKTAQAKLETEKHNFELKKWEFERQQKLLKEGFTTEADFKKAKTALETAKNNLKVAEEAVKQAKLAVEKEKKALKQLETEYKAKLTQAEAQYKQAKIRFSYSYIYAPKSGIISYVSTQEGETVVAGMNAPEFVTILDPEKLENWIYVDETEIGKIKKGQKVVFTVDTYRDKKFKGSVVEIYPEPTVLNNVVYYIVVARGFNDVSKLKLNMTTHNKIIIGIKKNVLVVPNEAVKWKKGKYVVYKVVGGKVKEVPVKVGWSDDKYMEILSGLKEGDKIAIKVKVK
ncbi:efflux RND transporter periplasmic adaptor subunit [Desulfurobacterium atlanticum]|uniref:HlyD family secretion protein/membrane fusion protein, macrolide-specific efflux system n=1 Tax=Desulfurobacterium atlanticum TaxID=240169 RepID=A0A238YHK7_9BACT|nr:efflux RND transporter periplasmic adaptor subunit [Desulfurobacterium atlanticum]SNR70746.1 HlyD family secretion protein/membrane fusion protein, macrolide-specific efflux system [Desulfurobacterium atlanticum]